MAEQRLRYTELAPQGMAAMRALEHYCNAETGLEPVLLELVRLRASLLNGCDYCVAMHTHELGKHNETPNRIARVADWQHFDGYTHREQAALAWTETVTNIQQGHAPDEAYAAAREHFAEPELVNLTLAIVSINSWNRMAISFRAQRHAQPVSPPQAPEAASPGRQAAERPGANQEPNVAPEPAEASTSAVGDDGGKVAVDD